MTTTVPLDRGAAAGVTAIVNRIMRSAAPADRVAARERPSDVSAFQSAI
ncbi:hypothetical protein [Actinoplanes subglobosus]|uniref:FXSXX-COOH protein n=1 Tax=Actinoplanes subglobosus TaxID=1547892 RepID=A0ABV8J3B8_9ACTN